MFPNFGHIFLLHHECFNFEVHHVNVIWGGGGGGGWSFPQYCETGSEAHLHLIFFVICIYLHLHWEACGQIEDMKASDGSGQEAAKLN